MTRPIHGRHQPSPPLPYPGSGAPTINFAFPWNAPRSAIFVDKEPRTHWSTSVRARQHPLVKAHLKRLKKRSLLEKPSVAGLEAIEPVSTLLQIRRDRATLARLKHEVEQSAWMETPAGVETRFNQQPMFIRRTFQAKIAWLRANRPDKHTNAFLMGTIKSALVRLEAVRNQQHVASNAHAELAAYYRGVYTHLPEFSKRRIKSMANEAAGRVNEMFCTAIDDVGGDVVHIDNKTWIYIYCHLAEEVWALRIMPPGWRELRQHRDNPQPQFDHAVLASAFARLIDADWWERKLWRLRNDWRENQMRAAGLVHKRAHPYISKDALADWLEQKRRNFEFFKAHELVDNEGNTVSLEDMVNASTSNPAIRRHELMNRMAGVELVAQQRGDAGVFYTITCPSKYHANNHSGHLNPKWDGSTPKQAQRYLADIWAKIGAKLGREGLRPYGFRVAEPHHDETPHWHLLLFMRPEDRKRITEIMRDYAIAEDRAELGRRTSARFTAKRLDPKKGSATAYIAKYISKNIDGHALDGERDFDTGKPLKETAKLAMAWASRHRIKQYQPLGTPPISVWRELRKLSNQLTGDLIKSGNYKRGQRLLRDPAMDAVLAAADVGCFATYILRQGGVLIPRKDYVVRIAYQDSDKPNPYGEVVSKIYGIYSPRIGEASRTCTRLKEWTIVAKKHTESPAAKADSGNFLTLPDGSPSPWSSVNNSTGEQKASVSGEGIGSTSAQKPLNFTRMNGKERRALLQRIRNVPPSPANMAKTQPPAPDGQETTPSSAGNTAAAMEAFARSIGLALEPWQIDGLLAGDAVDCGDGYAFRLAGGHLLEVPVPMARENDDDTPPPAYRTGDIATLADALGIHLEPWEVSALLRGATLDIGAGEAIRLRGDRLEPVRRDATPF
ncbi:replication endonuclease [Serratia bockelmannii]|uniref:replication endonuclease n=1 Tax=Serratia bockelmannii TaxID=2703793 RepID=UPI00313ECD96